MRRTRYRREHQSHSMSRTEWTKANHARAAGPPAATALFIVALMAA